MTSYYLQYDKEQDALDAEKIFKQNTNNMGQLIVKKSIHNDYYRWLFPLGFVEIFKNDIEVHFIKNKVRVCVNLEYGHFYLHTDIIEKKHFSCSIKSSKYVFKDERFEALFKDIEEQRKKLVKKSLKEKLSDLFYKIFN